MSRFNWTSEKINKVITEYYLKGPAQLGLELGLSSRSVYEKAKQFGLKIEPKNKKNYRSTIGPKKGPRITIECLFCKNKKEFQPYRSTAKYCSLNCRNEHYRVLANTNEINSKILELYKDKRTAAQIAIFLNLSNTRVRDGLISLGINTGHKNSSRPKLAYKFKKNKVCEMCGFERALDAAHIIPHIKGGTMEDDNLLALCPNHHRLFDNKKLTLEEAQKISYKVKNYMDYVHPKYKRDL
ncbi:HNH endonuclease [bacterium]|nr:HNH endonuclease [bacterium]